MRRMIREHSKDVIAIVALTAVGLAAVGVILANQRATFPDWVPLLSEDRFELKAQFESAQAVTPGQGQSVVIAGIRVGDITGVELEDGHAVVTMEVENEYAPVIREDAALLLRPKTGLNDMVIEVDPGISPAPVEEGDEIPLASTEPQVNPDEILAALDADTRTFLRLLLAGGGEGLGGRGRQLSATLRRIEPTVRDIARINGLLAKRRRNIAGAIHSFRVLSEELADKDAELVQFVDSSNAVLDSFARQEASLRATVRELPPTLRETRGALANADRLALDARPALTELLPGARALEGALRRTQPFLRRTVAPIRDQIRPFTRRVARPVKHVRQGAYWLGQTTPPLRLALRRLNQLLNALAYNPPGAGSEGYLFFTGWLNHNLNGIYLTQDAMGPLRRGMVLLSCNTSRKADAFGNVFPYLRTLIDITRLPLSSEIC